LDEPERLECKENGQNREEIGSKPADIHDGIPEPQKSEPKADAF